MHVSIETNVIFLHHSPRMINDQSRWYQVKYFTKITFLARLLSSNVRPQIVWGNVGRFNVRFELRKNMFSLCEENYFWFYQDNFQVPFSLCYIQNVNFTCLQMAFIKFISKWICLLQNAKTSQKKWCMRICLWCEMRTYSPFSSRKVAWENHSKVLANIWKVFWKSCCDFIFSLHLFLLFQKFRYQSS